MGYNCVDAMQRLCCLLVFVGLILSQVPAWGQVPENLPGLVRCETDENDQELHGQMGWSGRASFFQWLDRQMAARPELRAAQAAQIISLPVIVHVIHDGEEPGTRSNLSQAQIYSQLEVLNEDFRRMAGTPGFNEDPVGADIQIEFCPARVDPDGQILEEPGIHRINRRTRGFPAPPYSRFFLKSDLMPLTIWDPEKYINIWVCDADNERGQVLLGFAQYPNASSLSGIPANNGLAQTDGIVINYKAFGREGSLLFPFIGGRTTTHEMGHYLGLMHVWGEDGQDDGGCEIDDYCLDTPPSDGPVYGCPDNLLLCGARSMVENYMQYTDDGCMNIFTQDQKARILAVLQLADRRKTLLSSNVCAQPAAPPVARFEATASRSCTETTLQFYDRSLNLPHSWSWRFTGGKPYTSDEPNPQVRYDEPGIYDVTLTVKNAYGEDVYTLYNAVTVRSDSRAAFFRQDFESGFSGWTVVNPDQELGWEVKSVGGSRRGDKALTINGYLYNNPGQKDRLLSPIIDLSGKKSVWMAFDHAYRRSTPLDKDSLVVYASTDGGRSYPHRLLALGGTSLATGQDDPYEFVPLNPQDWCHGGQDNLPCNLLDLSPFDGTPEFRLSFEFINDNGNSLFLDNIALTSVCNGETPTPLRPLIRQEIGVYPNPGKDQFWIDLSALGEQNIQIQVLDMPGRVVYAEDGVLAHQIQEKGINLAHLRAGTYLLLIQGKDRMYYRRISIL